jgi:hypothetical protein
MSYINTIIKEVKKDGTFNEVYIDQEGKYIYSRIVFFPNWNMFFLYINKQFIEMSNDINPLLNLAHEAKETLKSKKLMVFN